MFLYEMSIFEEVEQLQKLRKHSLQKPNPIKELKLDIGHLKLTKIKNG